VKIVSPFLSPCLDGMALNATISPSTLLEKNAQVAEDRINICCILPPTPRIRYLDTRNEGWPHH
jgi:hypothetical protein